MFKVNPYRPGAGLMPTFLAGRDDYIEEIQDVFEALKHNIPVQSFIYSGLRGVGKTVLINKLYSIAEEKDIFCKHIEVETRKDFIAQIASFCQIFLRELNRKEKAKHLIEKAIDSIKSLVVSFDSGNNTFSLSLQERDFYTTSDLSMSLTEVFTSVGNAARVAETPICFFIDEIQYMKKDELGALITAVHRVNQLGYPMMVIGAGLPKIKKMLSDERSYAERLFAYRDVGSLEDEQIYNAIIEPVKSFGVKYTDEALDKIADITSGYPFFIQQMCKIVYDNTDGKIIDITNVELSVKEFFKVLDNGFFKVRYERCSDAEKTFVFAMVDCDKLPCSISNISKYYGKNGKSISPIRAKLIDKGIIYPVKHGELDFTVPEFTGYIQRLDEYKHWCDEIK